MLRLAEAARFVDQRSPVINDATARPVSFAARAASNFYRRVLLDSYFEDRSNIAMNNELYTALWAKVASPLLPRCRGGRNLRFVSATCAVSPAFIQFVDRIPVRMLRLRCYSRPVSTLDSC